MGASAPAQFVSDVFGVASAQQIDTQVTELPARDNPASEAVRNIVKDAREKRRSAMRVSGLHSCYRVRSTAPLTVPLFLEEHSEARAGAVPAGGGGVMLLHPRA